MNQNIKKYSIIPQYNKNVVGWLSFSIFVSLSILIALGCWNLVNICQSGISSASDFLWKWWTKWWSYFTVQSNFIVCIVGTMYWFKKDKNKFNYSTILFSTSYITITMLIYCAILFPSDVFAGNLSKWNTYSWIFNIFAHLIVPIESIIFFFFIFKNNNTNFKNKNYFSTLGYGMIYPWAFIVYAMIIPFLSNYSVYGQFTSLNPAVDNGGNLMLLFFILGAFLFFAFISLYFLYAKKQNEKK